MRPGSILYVNGLRLVRLRLEYLALQGLLKIFCILPEAGAYRLGEGLGSLVFWIDRRHQRVAIDNLRIAFGKEKDEQELKAIARRSYQHLGQSLAELARALASPPDKIMAAVSIEGLDHFLEAHKNGRGVLYLTAHLGNWEWMALVQSLKGYAMNVVARPVDNPFLEGLLSRLRTRWGNRVVKKGGALRKVLKLLNQGETIGFLLDQNVAPDQGVFVNFFGQPACTHKTLALLALKTGASVLPAFTFRQGGNRHRIIIEPPVMLEETGDLQRDVVANTQKFTSVIESYVRQHPDQWLWVHRRWKTQPEQR
ncbi:MAG: lysophospholipid acyltransferase family protein [Nitrospiria bacterium]